MGTHAQETTVKWFWSGMQGAPSTPSLKTLMTACLINGFNQLTVDSLVIANGVATVTRASGHGYTLDSIINVAGVTSPAGINGDHRVLSVSTTTFTFDASSFSDEAATGTIITKTAPVGGWSIPFSSGDKFVLRSSDAASPRGYFRFSNDGVVESRSATAYELMSDVDTGTNQWGGTQYYPDGSEVISWMLYADKRTVYFTILYNCSVGTTGNTRPFMAVGDFISFLEGDLHAELLHLQCNAANRRPSASSLLDVRTIAYHTYGIDARMRRHSSGAIGGCRFYPLAQSINSASGVGGISFPSPVNNAIVLADVLLREVTGGDALRGRARGILWSLSSAPLNDQWPPQTVEGVAGMEGRVLHILPFNASYDTTTQTGRVAIDITGPWEA